MHTASVPRTALADKGRSCARAPSPASLIRPLYSAPRREDDGAMDERAAADRMVVGVDGSPQSLAALRYAATLATALGASIEVVTTWSYPPVADSPMLADWDPAQDAARALDATVAEAFDGDPPSSLTRAVVSGGAAKTLIERSAGSRMLVLGSRGHGGFVGLVLGSVSTACAAHAKCPVLIVH